jgi:hypothetical protein
VGARWQLEYEYALIGWIERERPSLLEICAVIRWVRVCKSMGPPVDDVVPSPDPERLEDKLTTIPMANIDVLYLAYEGGGERIMMVRDFTGF